MATRRSVAKALSELTEASSEATSVAHSGLNAPKVKNKPSTKMGAKKLLLTYLTANVGIKVTSDQLREAAGNVSEWARRLRELRDEDGYPIRSHRDLGELKPGEYLLENLERAEPRLRSISGNLRAMVLERDGYTCQMCGLEAGQPDPRFEKRKVLLQVGHIKDKSHGGTDEISNLRALCSWCNEGASNVSPTRPDRTRLLTEIRRAVVEDQRAVYDWLQKKFPSR